MRKIFIFLIFLFFCFPLIAQENPSDSQMDHQGEGEPQKQYYETGELKAEANVKDGTGVVKTYYQSGAIKSIRNYVDHKKEGSQKDFYESGSLQGEGKVNDGTGVDKQYYEGGALKSITNYVQYEKEGEYKEFNEDGSLKETKNYDDYSRKKLQDEMMIKNAEELQKKDGPYFQYYPTGAVMVEGNLKNGKMAGLQKYFYENGGIRAMVEYKNEKREMEQEYFENGELKIERTFQKGKLKEVKRYDEKGSLLSAKEF